MCIRCGCVCCVCCVCASIVLSLCVRRWCRMIHFVWLLYHLLTRFATPFCCSVYILYLSCLIFYFRFYFSACLCVFFFLLLFMCFAFHLHFSIAIAIAVAMASKLRCLIRIFSHPLHRHPYSYSHSNKCVLSRRSLNKWKCTYIKTKATEVLTIVNWTRKMVANECVCFCFWLWAFAEMMIKDELFRILYMRIDDISTIIIPPCVRVCYAEPSFWYTYAWWQKRAR